ncbi:threonine dehydratase [Elstera litoralis]|uniref:Threonine dehydratase n=1 Tax=Elstera litoralis TaxID=552518 RepID=A0A0F3IPU5_9PROT|nr:pyridoxal-phosphate dependent enzyme [Elstera litoralis]KJV08637.1 threonine dehydratase [Elstera litoralis]
MSPHLPPPSAAGIRAAYAAIDPVFLNTPFWSHPAADAALSLPLAVKVEGLNPTRAFKGRGTDWFLAGLAPSDQLLVSASAGNFGQGLAYAARARSRRVILFAATTANPLKIEAMRRLGAEVRLEGHDFDAAKAAARTFAEQQDGLFIEDGAHPRIAEGAGTMALEMTRARLEFDTVLVPLGNGALLTGIGAWLKAERPGVRVIGIVAAAAPAMRLSWEAGHPITTANAATIADGIAVRAPVPYALACMPATVDAVWEVSEASLRAAMRFCHEYYGLVVEPAGAAGVAAALEHKGRLAGHRLATILCGSNLSETQRRDFLRDPG